MEGDLIRIGVGNLLEEEYNDADQKLQSGLRAGLWIFVRGHPDLDQHIRVSEGDIIEVVGYKIRVVEIDAEDGYVALGITPPS